jgi:hypothetical protein
MTRSRANIMTPMPPVWTKPVASFRDCRVVEAERRALAARGIDLHHVPAYSPELNWIESVSRRVK